MHSLFVLIDQFLFAWVSAGRFLVGDNCACCVVFVLGVYFVSFGVGKKNSCF